MSYKQREQVRIPVETLCSELVGEREHYGLIVDFAESGLKLQRPLRGRPKDCDGRIIQLEFEMPDVDEIVWAKGEVCFDQLWRGSLRTTGVRLVAAATRHLRMLRDYVIARDEARRRDEDLGFSLAWASHWAG
ncbi:MAG TPA: PilZ domain-containing protein [Polyangia bacterium]|nr:PilZ domain-containing protein [Polyangia bacterium]